MHRACLIGTGNIASAHADAIKQLPQVEIAGVFDANASAATNFASRHGIGRVYQTLSDVLQDQSIMAVHVLTPPGTHSEIALQTISAGKHTLVEKPIAISSYDALQLVEQSRKADLVCAVNQNLCYVSAYSQAEREIRAGNLGTLRYLSVSFEPVLRQLVARQFSHWMFKTPKNLLLEQAIHPLSQILHLMQTVDYVNVTPGRLIEIGNGAGIVPEFTAVLVNAITTCTFRFRVGASFPVMRIDAHCDDGLARIDLVTGTVLINTRGPFLDPVDHATSNVRAGLSLARQGMSNALAYGLSTAGLQKRSDSFSQSMQSSVSAFYDAVDKKKPLFTDAAFGARLVELCEEIERQLPAPKVKLPTSQTASEAAVSFNADPRPMVVVFGGTGFIGAPTVKELLAAGFKVRVVARGMQNLANEFYSNGIQLMQGDVKNERDIESAVAAAQYVINLAHGGGGSTYEAIRTAMVDSASAIATASAAAGVTRLVQVGSIAGLYLGNSKDLITGGTPVDPHSASRGDYARAKAEADAAVEETCSRLAIDYVLLRPGIVVGTGTSPLHSGLGFYNNEQHVIGWNSGNNAIPFVLVEDVARAIVSSMKSPKASGRAYNLAGDVAMSAREYIELLGTYQKRPLKFHPRSPTRLWAEDALKWMVKRIAGRKVPLTSIRDLRSRGMVARFDCSDAKADLGWQPEFDRGKFIQKAIAVHSE
jgi:predicted dehydrogenase/nucleoside-diphosphate-sugar epimerase